GRSSTISATPSLVAYAISSSSTVPPRGSVPCLPALRTRVVRGAHATPNRHMFEVAGVVQSPIVDPANLARLLSPESVAVVGVSVKLGMSNNAVLPMLEAGLEVALVNPNRDSVYDRPTVPSL